MAQATTSKLQALEKCQARRSNQSVLRAVLQSCKFAHVPQRFADALFLPLPATKEWGEDRGEGQSKAVETNVPPLPNPPPCDGGEGVAATLPRWGNLCPTRRELQRLGVNMRRMGIGGCWPAVFSPDTSGNTFAVRPGI